MKIIMFLWFSLTVQAALSQSFESVMPITNQNIDSLRTAIEQILLGGADVPEIPDDTTMFDLASTSAFYSGSPNVRSVHMYRLPLANGFSSCIYHLQPSERNGLNIPIIYHSGHGYGVFLEDDWVNNSWQPYSARVMDYFLQRGYDVIGIDMPMFANNEYPANIVRGNDTINIYGHDDIFLLQHPFSYFMAPIKSAVDFFEREFGYTDFVMLGLSGGGWSTTLYSSIDTRIKMSFPVAGSIPVPLRTLPRDYGDMEQYYSSFYDVYNYSTLYALGAAGEERFRYQILNEFDDCCFSVNGHEYWVDSVQSALERQDLPGEFNFYYNSMSAGHRISSIVLDTINNSILRHLANKKFENLVQLKSESSENIICSYDSMNLTVLGPGITGVKWIRDGSVISGAETNTLTAKEEGNYSALLVNISGAVASTAPLSLLHHIIETPVLTGQNDILFSSAPNGNEWYYNDSLLSGIRGNFIHPMKPGRYSVRFDDGNCVSDMSSVFYYGTRVYPSPAKNTITIQAGTGSSYHLFKIINSEGRVLQAGNIQTIATVRLDNKITSGIYFLQLLDRQGVTTTMKLVVNR